MGYTTNNISAEGEQTASINLDSSKVTWVGTKPIGQHNGTFNLSEGNIIVKDDEVSGGNFKIDINSLAVEDLKPAQGGDKLAEHLKSADFFDAAQPAGPIAIPSQPAHARLLPLSQIEVQRTLLHFHDPGGIATSLHTPASHKFGSYREQFGRSMFPPELHGSVLRHVHPSDHEPRAVHRRLCTAQLPSGRLGPH